MPRFAANLSMMFTEVDFLDRFAQANKAGFKAVEFLFPYDYAPEVLAKKLQKYHLQQALFNMPPGDWQKGERGLAALYGREQEFRDNVALAIKYANILDCKLLHAMAGIVTGLDYSLCEKTFIENLQYAADQALPHGITILIEPINSRNMPGYFISHQHEGLALLEKIDRLNVKIQYDLYHAQIMDGDLTKLTEKMFGKFAHIQIASVPERHEPDEGEVNFPYIFAKLDEMGYQGHIGCEYNPRSKTEDGLAWFAPYKEQTP